MKASATPGRGDEAVDRKFRMRKLLSSTQWRRFSLTVTGLVLAFSIPLWRLIRFAAGSELYSYILLIPFISLYLVWRRRASLPLPVFSVRGSAVILLMAGVALAVLHWERTLSGGQWATEDALALLTASFLLCLYGVVSLFWGGAVWRVASFPLVFLIFMVPLPVFVGNALDTFLQAGSSVAAGSLFRLSGTPYYQDGLTFQLPDISLRIASECSGIHSTLVLFITSLLAGQLVLRTTWKRCLLVLFIIPLGILRNGFRVFVIGELCVHIGPQMIDSPIHHKGGPLFFVLSLFPLLFLLVWLQRSEAAGSKAVPSLSV